MKRGLAAWLPEEGKPPIDFGTYWMRKKRLVYVLMRGQVVAGVYNIKRKLRDDIRNLQKYHQDSNGFVNLHRLGDKYRNVGKEQSFTLNEKFWVKIMIVGE